MRSTLNDGRRGEREKSPQESASGDKSIMGLEVQHLLDVKKVTPLKLQSQRPVLRSSTASAPLVINLEGKCTVLVHLQYCYLANVWLHGAYSSRYWFLDRAVDRDRIPDQDYQVPEQVGEHHGGENMVEEEHRHDEEEESQKQDNVRGPDSGRERREPEPSPTISSRDGPQGKDVVAAN